MRLNGRVPYRAAYDVKGVTSTRDGSVGSAYRLGRTRSVGFGLHGSAGLHELPGRPAETWTVIQPLASRLRNGRARVELQACGQRFATPPLAEVGDDGPRVSRQVRHQLEAGQEL